MLKEVDFYNHLLLIRTFYSLLNRGGEQVVREAGSSGASNRSNFDCNDRDYLPPDRVHSGQCAHNLRQGERVLQGLLFFFIYALIRIAHFTFLIVARNY